MFQNTESLSLIRWMLKTHHAESILFYPKKVVNYFFRSLGWKKKKYPKIINKFVNADYIFNKKPVLDVLNSSIKHVNDFYISAIKLASLKYKLDSKNIDWSKNWEDTEDEESLHRWNWAIYELSSFSVKDQDSFTSWVVLQHENWIDRYQTEIMDKKIAGKLRWESYTVSERVSNTTIFYYQRLGGWPSNKISDAVKGQVSYLIHHLEYFGEDTGNHIINNARAIYLAGVAFGCEIWRELAFTIIKLEVPKLVNKDGFLREGSSHYQFLFTRWILEINDFALLVDDNKMANFLATYLQLLIQQCHFFLVYNREKQEWDFPLFGDISPDFQPEWLRSLPWSSLAESFIKPPDPKPDIQTPCWNSLWLNKDYSYQHRSSNDKKKPSSNKHVLSTMVFPESGWFRVVFGDNTLFYRVDPNTALDYVGHHHQDLYHYCLYHKGIPIFVDAGRKDYDNKPDSWGRFGLSPKAHNSVMVDGVGSLPETPVRYPKKYIQSENKTYVQQLENSVLITIESACFKRLVSPIVLIRRIFLDIDSFKIEDEFIGHGKHHISTFFHFAPEVQARVGVDNSWRLTTEMLNANFYINQQDQFQVTQYHADDRNWGWTVPAYGKTIAASTLVVEGRVQLPVTLKYQLCLEL